LQPAEGAVAAASQEKHLGKSRVDSPSKKKQDMEHTQHH